MENLGIRLQQGDETAFCELYDLFHRKLYRFCYGFLKDHQQSQEVVQETFLSLWTSYCNPNLRQDTSIESLLFTIAHRNLIDSWRKQIALNKCKEQALYHIPKFENETEAYTISRDFDQIYQNAFAQLTEQQQKVFLLSREEGLSYHEIAERMHISKNTVKYHLTNALSIFRKYLSKYGILSVLFYWIFRFL